jgi:hypothetical protein
VSRRRSSFDETSPLLAQVNRTHNPSEDEDADIQAAEDEAFDLMLAKVASNNSALGIEPESQETALLRDSWSSWKNPEASGKQGPRYGSIKPRDRQDDDYDEEEEAAAEASDETSENDAIVERRYLGGVSNRRFWLIFGSILFNYLVCGFWGVFFYNVVESTHMLTTCLR